MSLSKLAAIVTLLLAGITASVISYLESRADLGGGRARAESASTTPQRTATGPGAGAPAQRSAPAALVQPAEPAGLPDGDSPPAELGCAKAPAGGEREAEEVSLDFDSPRSPAERITTEVGEASRWQRVRRSERAPGSLARDYSRCSERSIEAAPAAGSTGVGAPPARPTASTEPATLSRP